MTPTAAISMMAAVCCIVVLFVISDIALRRENAKKDLREVYPPKRDRFHRDLERLNKLRDTPPMVLPRRPAKKWLMLGNPATPDDYAMAIVFIVVLTALGLWMASQL